MILAPIGMAAGAAAGGALGHLGTGSVVGLAGGALAGILTAHATVPDTPAVKDWNRVQEDEADKTAFEWVMRANLDVQEIPKVYRALKDAAIATSV